MTIGMYIITHNRLVLSFFGRRVTMVTSLATIWHLDNQLPVCGVDVMRPIHPRQCEILQPDIRGWCDT